MKREVDVHLLSRHVKVILEYYINAEPFKTEAAYKEWLSTLNAISKEAFEEMGFNRSVNSFPFMRYILEKYGYVMDEFMKNNLSAVDYLEWKHPRTDLVVPKEMNIINPEDWCSRI